MTRDRQAVRPPAPEGGTGAAAPVSSLVGRYRLVSEQGTGLFGVVWLAEEAATGRPVALRLLPRELTGLANVAETIRRRARAVIEASRGHPALVRVLEYGTTDDGQLFAVMERAEGRPLSDTFDERQRLTGPAALRLAVEMGGPVETLHTVGLVHGAIRPGNFLVADGRVTLMDVETAALRDAPALQHLVAARSPAAYLAPEQIQGRPVTEKTDVYAFGATLYELLAGAPPFEASARGGVLDMHLNAPPPLMRRRRRTVPVSVEAILMEALDKRPEQRPFMARVLNHVATEAGSGTPRWRRAAVLAAGLVGAVAIAAPIASSVLITRAPAPTAGPASAPPAPAPADAVSQAAVSAGTFLPAAPAVAPSPIEAPAAPSVEPPPIGPPPPPPAATAARAERTQPPREPAPPPRRTAARSGSSSNTEEPDPASAIDWLFTRRGQ